MPALLTRMSMRPWRSRMVAATLATAFWSPTSRAIASSPGCWSVFSLRPEITTVAPALFSACAPARPMPEPPPVIQATLSFSVLGGAKKNLRLLLREAGRLAAPVRQDLDAALDRRAPRDAVATALERGKVIDAHARALGRAQPRA